MAVNQGEITARQIAAARALLGWTQEDLRVATKLGIATIRRLEDTETSRKVTSANRALVHQTLEDAGVIFEDAIPASDHGPGVRLRLQEETET
tara:strand:+ start:2185 stop:2463 length:279 start_codon:yes stop_codon:yes gene_type:complete